GRSVSYMEEVTRSFWPCSRRVLGFRSADLSQTRTRGNPLPRRYWRRPSRGSLPRVVVTLGDEPRRVPVVRHGSPRLTARPARHRPRKVRPAADHRVLFGAVPGLYRDLDNIAPYLVSRGATDESTCTPGSVTRFRGPAAIHLGLPSPTGSSG